MTKKRNRLPNLSDEEKQRIAEAYRKRVSIKVIAARHSRALSTVSKVVAQLGIPRRYNRETRT